MKEPSDDERLAALLDGRVDDRRRAELLAHLAASDEDYEVFRDTAVILRRLEEGAPAVDPDPPDVIPLPVRPLPEWFAPAARVALAAVLAALVLGGVRLWRERAAAGDPLHLAARLEASGRGLPAGWTEERPWTVIRGGGAVPVGTPRERAVASAQAGAMLTDLAVAVRSGDAAGTRLLAEQVRARFDRAAGRGTPLRQIEARAGAPPASLEPLVERATDRLEGSLEKEPLRLGAWTEAARLAARRGDEAFLEARANRRMLERVGRATAGVPAAAAALARVRAELAAETPAWDAVERDLGVLLKALAS